MIGRVRVVLRCGAKVPVSLGCGGQQAKCACDRTSEDDRSREAFISFNRILPDMHKGLVVIGVGAVAFFLGALLAGFEGNWLALAWGPFAFAVGYLAGKWA